jgi:hypothetical protein
VGDDEKQHFRFQRYRPPMAGATQLSTAKVSGLFSGDLGTGRTRCQDDFMELPGGWTNLARAHPVCVTPAWSTVRWLWDWPDHRARGGAGGRHDGFGQAMAPVGEYLPDGERAGGWYSRCGAVDCRLGDAGCESALRRIDHRRFHQPADAGPFAWTRLRRWGWVRWTVVFGWGASGRTRRSGLPGRWCWTLSARVFGCTPSGGSQRFALPRCVLWALAVWLGSWARSGRTWRSALPGRGWWARGREGFFDADAAVTGWKPTLRRGATTECLAASRRFPSAASSAARRSG